MKSLVQDKCIVLLQNMYTIHHSVYTEEGELSLKVIYYRFMVFSATFNNISVISWGSVLLVEEIGAPKENSK